MPCEDTGLPVTLKLVSTKMEPARPRAALLQFRPVGGPASEHAMESPASFSISEFVNRNYPIADPKIASQA
jgi:hypothetical protein